MGNRTSCHPIQSVIYSYSWLNKLDSCYVVVWFLRTLYMSDFINHLSDYRPNWTPLSPITFIGEVLLYCKPCWPRFTQDVMKAVTEGSSGFNLWQKNLYEFNLFYWSTHTARCDFVKQSLHTYRKLKLSMTIKSLDNNTELNKHLSVRKQLKG